MFHVYCVFNLARIFSFNLIPFCTPFSLFAVVIYLYIYYVLNVVIVVIIIIIIITIIIIIIMVKSSVSTVSALPVTSLGHIQLSDEFAAFRMQTVTLTYSHNKTNQMH